MTDEYVLDIVEVADGPDVIEEGVENRLRQRLIR